MHKITTAQKPGKMFDRVDISLQRLLCHTCCLFSMTVASGESAMVGNKCPESLSELRMTVRSSLFRPADKGHTHSYGPESHDPENDEYFKVCGSCGHRMSYEKM